MPNRADSPSRAKTRAIRKNRKPLRGTPQEPRHTITLNALFMVDDPPRRAAAFVSWARRQLGIQNCRNVAEVRAVRASRDELASRQRELIAKIDDAYVLAEALYPTRTAAQLRATGMRLCRGTDGKRVKDSAEIMDFVVGDLAEALWLTRKRLKQQELRAPIRLEGPPLRVDVDLMQAVHEATTLSFAEVVRRVYERLGNVDGERDAFVSGELRALQKARQRRYPGSRRNRIRSGE